MAKSQNGYSVVGESDIRVWIVGDGRKIKLRKGSTGWLLQHWGDWFDKNIENIDSGQLDDWGYSIRSVRGYLVYSNHASGTAMDLNALRHPISAHGTFSKAQVAKIHAHLKEFEGCIRWGGDFNGRKDEMHFEINKPPQTCYRVAKKLGRKV